MKHRNSLSRPGRKTGGKTLGKTHGNIRGNTRGNTMVEYCLLFALVSVATVGALTMFGGSVSKLLGGQGASTTAAEGNILAGIGTSNGANGNTLAMAETSGSSGHWASSSVEDWWRGVTDSLNPNGGSSGGTGSASNFDLNADAATTGPGPYTGSGAFPISGGGSGGTNVTSMEGNIKLLDSNPKVNAVLQTMETANQLNALADKLDDGPLKEWYRQAANAALLLAGSEASYSYKAEGIEKLAILADTSLQSQDALYSIQQNRLELGAKLYDFPADLAPNQKDVALNLVHKVLGSMWDQYGGTLDRYTVGSTSQQGLEKQFLNLPRVLLEMGLVTQTYDKTPEQVLALGKVALSQGDLTGSNGISTGVVNGSDLNDRGAN